MKLVVKWSVHKKGGHLSHACRPGRHFLRGLFGLISQFRRQDHMNRLNSAFWSGCMCLRLHGAVSP